MPHAPKTHYRKDYKKPDFSIKTVYLDFIMNENLTHVKCRTEFVRQTSGAQDLVLDGQDMTLVSIELDGQDLPADKFHVDENHLQVKNVPDHFTLDIVTEIEPEKNTALEGLYKSSGNYCTQCEAEGFRKITYYLDRPDVMAKYTTRIEADKTKYPVLLSNGNCIEQGDLDDGRHYTVWEDPFPKPSYLFALVAGDLAVVQDTFTTRSGRTVDLFIYVNHGNEDKCAHAMDSLKRSMTWDEEKYGCEYDLDIFNIVAVNDFNMGAMENKSLNIFNSKLILARPDTATDMDYLSIEGVVAHEYFHNWTGNRITCRDWFQLSLKEGLTVFRDQCFSADMNAPDVQRIDDVMALRNGQFPEDASPMAHPVRPDSYIEINNFYTATVYNKGAELIRMMHTLLGEDNYRKGTDLYFKRHDGQAVTCDDFAQCMEDGSGIGLSQFKLWYEQAGTPTLTAKSSYDEEQKTFTLTLTQDIPDTPGQTDKKPMHMPISVGLLGTEGHDLIKTRVLQLKDVEQDFVFENIPEKPVPSILRGFSAPVKMKTDLSDDDLLFLMAHDSDGFNRWDAGQTYMQRLILDLANNDVQDIPDACLNAFGALIRDDKTDQSLIAKAMSLPSEMYLAQLMDIVNVEGIHDARIQLGNTVGTTHAESLEDLYRKNKGSGSYDIFPASMGQRSLKNIALQLLYRGDPEKAKGLAFEQYKEAHNMTDQIAALGILKDVSGQEHDEAYNDFYAKWKDDPVVLDKWFSLQAVADNERVVEHVTDLTQHADFTYQNPNRLRALIGAFAFANPRWFHRADGAGYSLLGDTIIHVNALNPSTAARLLTPFRQWKRYDADRQALMETQLRRILAEKNISNDVYEIASKSLDAA